MNPALPTILFAASDSKIAYEFENSFHNEYTVIPALSVKAAREVLASNPIAVVIAHTSLADEPAEAFLQELSSNNPQLYRVLCVAAGDTEAIVKALNRGVELNGCITLPLLQEQVIKLLRALLAPNGFPSMAGASPKQATDKPISASEVDTLDQQYARLKIETGSLMQELKDTHLKLIVSEKMAALGQLVANVAHEINTPVAAIKSSTLSIEKQLLPFVQGLCKLMLELPRDVAQLAYDFMAVAATNETSLTTREERQYRKELEERFVEAAIAEPAELARTLVEMQLVHGLQKYEHFFRMPQFEQVFQTVKQLGLVKGSLQNLSVSSEKVAKIIQALKSYSYVSRDEKFEPIQLDHSIQSILTIYHSLLKQGVQVVKNYQQLPPVPGIPDQLGQVWANLIHNAIQAMKGRGTLTLTAQLVEPYVLVQVTDTGSGIPPEIINRIFEPFFTTKEQGEGSGLGLDICRRIVERHRGRITVESKPEHTVFSVYLPLSQT